MIISNRFLKALLLLVALGNTAAYRSCKEEEREVHPVLCSMVDSLMKNPSEMGRGLEHHARQHGMILDIPQASISQSIARRNLRSSSDDQEKLPVVLAHGMGDSCFNSGMQKVVKHVSDLLNVYSVCIPIGSSQSEDTTNGYFLNMDASVDIFTASIANDPKLANGFHAIGFSQGNNIIRGYIARFNTPAVHTFISINGVNAGEGAVPHCTPSKTHVLSLDSVGIGFCDLLMEQASHAAYTDYAQAHSFQANYWRDPRPVEWPNYQKFSQLAIWNNEGRLGVNETLKENYAKTSRFVWILANDDHMVWPKEGEQWGAPDPQDPFKKILPREDTAWFQQDLFGLRTAEEAGKNFYETFEGDHLQFNWNDFDKWINTYIVGNN